MPEVSAFCRKFMKFSNFIKLDGDVEHTGIGKLRTGIRKTGIPGPKYRSLRSGRQRGGPLSPRSESPSLSPEPREEGMDPRRVAALAVTSLFIIEMVN